MTLRTPAPHIYRRELLRAERRFFRAPNANVVMTARIRGQVSADALAAVVRRLRDRHRLLAVRTLLDQQGNAFLTSDGAGDIVVTESPRRSPDQWVARCLDEHKHPFDLAARPPIRFILLHDDEGVDLIIVCHHMICDGLSLAYLTRDILTHLGDPQRQVDILPDPPVACAARLRAGGGADLSPTPSVDSLNQDWKKQQVLFDDEDYENIFRAYWDNYTFRLLSLEFTTSQTSRFLGRCREERVTVNSALLTSLLAAQLVVQGDGEPYLRRTGTAVSIRQFIDPSPGDALGLYAAGALFEFACPGTLPFWDVARLLHAQLTAELASKNPLSRLLATEQLEPSLFDAVQFKRFGKLVKPCASRYAKLASFSEREDVVSRMERKRSAEAKRGVILTNLARLDFPRSYGELELERLFFFPGTTELFEKAVGAVTASGRLTLVISYVEEVITSDKMADFQRALSNVLADEAGL